MDLINLRHEWDAKHAQRTGLPFEEAIKRIPAPKLDHTPAQTLSALEAIPSVIDQTLKDRVDAIEAMPRSERRKLGKQLGVKIPGSSKPIVLADLARVYREVEALGPIAPEKLL